MLASCLQLARRITSMLSGESTNCYSQRQLVQAGPLALTADKLSGFEPNTCAKNVLRGWVVLGVFPFFLSFIALAQRWHARVALPRVQWPTMPLPCWARATAGRETLQPGVLTTLRGVLRLPLQGPVPGSDVSDSKGQRYGCHTTGPCLVYP